MGRMIRTKVVKIGNSRGIRIPRTLLEQAGLTGEVEMTVEGDNLIIHSALRPRASWESQFAAMAAQHDDHLIAEPTPTQWDETEWTW